MAGTIIVDRIESDASYASSINVAGQITFSNTVNFGAFAGTAPVAGFYLPTTNNLAFTTASTERMRIDSAGNVGIGTASPASRLHVTGSGSPYISVTSTNTNNFVQAFDSIGLALGTTSSATNKNIAFYTNSTEYMRIDSSGNVGIGNTTPSSFDPTGKPLVVGSGSGNQGITIYAGTTGYSTVNFADGTTGTDRYSGQVSYDHTNNALLFATNTGAERMRIDSSGIVIIGGSSVTGNPIASRVSGISLNTPAGFSTSRGVGNWAMGLSTNSGSHITFYTDNGSTYILAGVITSTGSATAYGTGTSDYRAKENVTNYTGGLSTITSLRPVSFTWKASQEQDIGFIAHEIQAVIPSTVHGEKDAVDEDGNPKMQTIFPSPPQMIANLVAAIQEQQALIQSLTTRITALENK